MSDSLSSRIARSKAVAPDADNIRIALDGEGCEWRRERLWKVVQSLSVEHAAEIAWIEDRSGTMRVGIRTSPRISRSLLDALVVGWAAQCEYSIQLCGVQPDAIGGREWCDVSTVGHPENGIPSYTMTMVR